MDADRVTKAVLLDAMGTLLHLLPPVPRLQAELRERHGLQPNADLLARAVRAEMAHYRANVHRGGDARGLADLRRECADLVARELSVEHDLLEALLASLVFEPYDDVVPALTRWRRAGLRLVVVSNWDASLHEWLARTGLRPLLDGVVASAEVGLAKPDPGIFEHALELAGVVAAEALHVGDEPDEDVAGARAAGIEAVLLDRDGDRPDAARTIRSLAELLP